jgi:dGTPase
MAHKLSWHQLLSRRRPQPSDTGRTSSLSLEDDRSSFERDYDRVIFSAPFRRLAGKTQVHPMARNAKIHTRLTHSIEVASIGRGFTKKLVDLLKSKSDLSPDGEAALPWVIQSACLVHDLGNPPFGHAGEEVIRAWVEKHQDEMFRVDRFASVEEYKGCKADWLNFEGNAQGFRLASRKDNPDAGYLNLTHAALATAIKYPWVSTDHRAAAKRKLNVYSSESRIFMEMARDLGLLKPDGHVCRHPLSFLTEAADDICYRVIDLEDAVEMGIQDSGKVKELLLRISGNYGKEDMNLPQLRGYAIKALMDQFFAAFEGDFDAVMNGERVDDLKSSLTLETKGQLDTIKQIYGEIFGDSKKVSMELGAYHILGRILKALMKTVHAIHDSGSYEAMPFLSQRCAELVWGRGYAPKHFGKCHAWWLARMNDAVSGLTDDAAMSLSNEIAGHSFGGY